MLQNSNKFIQTSVSLEIIGLPDYSNNENKDFISIISQWKLMIIDKPLIEGSMDHLKSIMKAFYTYSSFLLNNEDANYESTLIDIKTDNYYIHDVILKSSKPEVKPLNIKLGNAELSDIINCFDQVRTSNNIKLNFQEPGVIRKKNIFSFLNKKNISGFIVPPVISIVSLFVFSSSFMYFYRDLNNNKDNSFLNLKDDSTSISTVKTIL